MKQMSKYFTQDEFEHSATAVKNKIENKMNAEQLENATKLFTELIDPLMEKFAKFLLEKYGITKTPKGSVISESGFRCQTLNSHPDIRGSATSDHVNGCADDLKAFDSKYNRDLFNLAMTMPVFDQVILEMPNSQSIPKWVHLGMRKSANRKMALVAYPVAEKGTLKTKYKPFTS